VVRPKRFLNPYNRLLAIASNHGYNNLMKILVIDRDEVTANLIRARLEPVGHHVTYLANKTEGMDKIAQKDFDAVFIDPSPQTQPKPMIVSIKRLIRYYPYFVLLSSTLTLNDALTNGLNDKISKPFDPHYLDIVIDNAARLQSLLRHLSDDQEDFKSAGGVIAKSAFNQLFLSCIDRADRYGERAFVLFISIDNYQEIAEKFGAHEAEIIAAKMAQNLVKLRRASDIIGQTKTNEYALLLLRPSTDTEPQDAANRFAENMSKLTNMATQPFMDIDMSVKLVDLPAGHLLANHKFTLHNESL
jgi:diguanylate cyclase (GGDEF)-like protein